MKRAWIWLSSMMARGKSGAETPALSVRGAGPFIRDMHSR
jgi:hypothetical protein